MRNIVPRVIPLLACPILACATEPQIAAAPPPGFDGFALVSGDIKAAADIKDTPGAQVSRRQLGYELIGTGHIAPNTRLDLDYEFKSGDNHFQGIAAPYGDTRSHFFGAKIGHMIDATYGAGLIGGFEFAGEDQVDLLRDGLRGGLGITFLYNASETFTTETGASIQTMFGQDPRLSPYIKWKWQAAPQLELELRATGIQNGIVGTWYVTENKATSVRVSLWYETSLYALREDAPAEEVNMGETTLRLTLTQFLSEMVFVAARAELSLTHREDFFTDGTRIARFDTTPTPAIGIVAGLRF